MEEYLTTEELSKRIKMAEGTIRNLVWKKTFIEKVHYVKPTPRKLLFVWNAIEIWLYGNSPKNEMKSSSNCRINI
jgi:hypothetical protein